MKTRLFIILIASLAILSGCDHNYEFDQWECSTGDAYNITDNSATLEGYVNSYEWGNYSANFRPYFCYYTKADLSDAITVEAWYDYGYLIKRDISHLQRNKTYYYYAFLTTDNGVDTIKGDTRWFNTKY
jgi:hypothetical protein